MAEDAGASGNEVVLKLSNVCDLPKAPSQEWAIGAAIYRDSAEKRCTTVATGNRLIGIAVQPVGDSALEMVGGRFASAARVHGARPLQAFFLITFPLSIPAIAASLLIVFAMSMEEFGTPAALASRTGVEVLVTGINTRLSDWPIDLSGAALGSVMLMAMVLAAFTLQNWIATRRSYVSQTGKPADLEKADRGRWRWPVLGLFTLVALIGVVIPLAAIAVTSFMGTISGGLHWSNFDLRHYEPIFRSGSRAWQALMTSGWPC